jgi:hypothetical protein
MFTTPLRKALVTFVAGSALAAGATQSAMASGQTGQFAESGVTCYENPQYPQYNRVIAEAPSMSSSPVSAGNTFTVGGGLYGGGYHVQAVGYRAFLMKWNGRTWAYTGRYGPVKRGQTGDVVQPIMPFDNNSSTVFNTPGKGYYKIWMRYYWFADDQSSGGQLEAMSRVYENGQASFCAF